MMTRESLINSTSQGRPWSMLFFPSVRPLPKTPDNCSEVNVIACKYASYSGQEYKAEDCIGKYHPVPHFEAVRSTSTSALPLGLSDFPTQFQLPINGLPLALLTISFTLAAPPIGILRLPDNLPPGSLETRSAFRGKRVCYHAPPPMVCHARQQRP